MLSACRATQIVSALPIKNAQHRIPPVAIRSKYWRMTSVRFQGHQQAADDVRPYQLTLFCFVHVLQRIRATL